MYYQDDQYLVSFVRRAVPMIIVGHGGEVYREHESYLPNGGNIDEYLMQFTGILDKNGKEIYEGDIVVFDGLSNREDKVVGEGEVNFICGAFGVDAYYLHELKNTRLEVIGNIYENPDLLNSHA